MSRGTMAHLRKQSELQNLLAAHDRLAEEHGHALDISSPPPTTNGTAHISTAPPAATSTSRATSAPELASTEPKTTFERTIDATATLLAATTCSATALSTSLTRPPTSPHLTLNLTLACAHPSRASSLAPFIHSVWSLLRDLAALQASLNNLERLYTPAKPLDRRISLEGQVLRAEKNVHRTCMAQAWICFQANCRLAFARMSDPGVPSKRREEHAGVYTTLGSLYDHFCGSPLQSPRSAGGEEAPRRGSEWNRFFNMIARLKREMPDGDTVVLDSTTDRHLRATIAAPTAVAALLDFVRTSRGRRILAGRLDFVVVPPGVRAASCGLAGGAPAWRGVIERAMRVAGCESASASSRGQALSLGLVTSLYGRGPSPAGAVHPVVRLVECLAAVRGGCRRYGYVAASTGVCDRCAAFVRAVRRHIPGVEYRVVGQEGGSCCEGSWGWAFPSLSAQRRCLREAMLADVYRSCCFRFGVAWRRVVAGLEEDSAGGHGRRRRTEGSWLEEGLRCILDGVGRLRGG